MQPGNARVRVLGEEEVHVFDMVVPCEHGSQLAVFNVPLVKLRRERFFEPLYVCFDACSIGILLWRINLASVTQRREAPEIVIVFCELERVVSEVVTSY